MQPYSEQGQQRSTARQEAVLAGRRHVRRACLFGLFFCFWGCLSAQTAYSFYIHIDSSGDAVVREALKGFRLQPARYSNGGWQYSLPDSGAFVQCRTDLIRHLQEKSFLTASLDSLQAGPHAASTHLHLGPPMHWVRLRAGAQDAWMRATGFHEKLFAGKPLRHDALLNLQRKILETAENNGFPFARIWLDSIVIAPDGGVTALLQVNRMRFITFGDLKINGDLKLPPVFMRRYLGIQPGSPYSRASVLRLRAQLRTLQFIDVTGNPSVTFSGSEARVNLFLQKKRAGRFDFIIGLLPNSDQNNGKLLFTGTLSTAFQNSLNLGEHFSLEFERLKPSTQKLEVAAGVPYLFGSAFGADGRLHIFRRDSSWVDAQGDVGIQYLLTGGDYVRFFWENKSSYLQKIDTQTVLQTRRLPANLDLRQNGFGIEFDLNRLDYRFNPRQGWAVALKGVAGFNRVLRNNQIEALHLPTDPSFRFSSLYDSIAGREARYRAEATLEHYLPFFARSTLKLGLRGGGIFSPKPVFANEQYRIGGNKLLRGFDEESLFATRFAVASAEIRLLLGPNSFFAAFTDYAYLENITRTTRVYLHPWGIGAGLNFETKAGIFGISVAVGRRDIGQSLDFRAAKFHLGYVSLF